MSYKKEADSYTLSYLERRAAEVGFPDDPHISSSERERLFDDFMEELSQYDLSGEDEERLIAIARGERYH